MTETAVDGIRLERGANIDWIVLDRSEAANAFNAAMLARFSAALEECASEGAPVLGIRSAAKGFSAGMDLGEYNAKGSTADDVRRLSSYVERWKGILTHTKPVIVAVHGYCIGVAAQLASFADILILADDAKISEPSIPIGGGFIAPTWVNQVGARRSKEFAFLPGNWIDARTAVDWGWANAAVPAEQLVECAEALAARMAMVPPACSR
ncbi:enoyl-CoA hydratase/isomerase family protein [Novosphingobium sp. G106]|uniref:enoyl-CoA hydratase/isomerase family protein n=1 Tax=Novosphingobium sp. G106 TaxID=2849500 RepID=UPI0020C4B43D|nr:enoyl-CoA hydratase/isomerase family protein [Novosphingobium sp. G106]